MVIPKEIQNLILIRYYFYQWQEKIKKVNQQYCELFSIRHCIYCHNPTCQYLSWKHGSISFLFNWRHRNQMPIDNRIDIYNWKKFSKNRFDIYVVGKLPNTYFSSSG